MFAANVEIAISTETQLGYILCSLVSLSAISTRITVANSQRIILVPTINTIPLMAFKQTIKIYCEVYTNYINTLSFGNADSLTLKVVVYIVAKDCYILT